ncbi:MAG: hypothetical protein IKH11_09960 [Bacteroidales bacterium]|nr:hypothetical protein [Bacteroidales bacterium]
MRSVKRIFAVLLGFVFFGAGMLKLLDPVGAGLVAGEYYNFLHLHFLAPSANFVGVFLALIETFTGISLITGVLPIVTATVSGIMILAFTVLTFIMWLVNPSMDCGCFGQAIHLTHFQSFVKNIVLCILWVITFIPLSLVPHPPKIKYVSSSIAALSVALFTVYSLVSIPAVDFTSFAPGATLMQAEDNPEPDSPLLSVSDSSGDYCDEMLAQGTKLLFTVYDVESIPDSFSEKFKQCAAEASGAGAQPLIIASAGLPEDLACYFSDRRTLMTVNRSNGGATLLRDGVVVAKWPFRSLPDGERLAELKEKDSTEAIMSENTPKRLKLQGFLLYVFAVLLLL